MRDVFPRRSRKAAGIAVRTTKYAGCNDAWFTYFPPGRIDVEMPPQLKGEIAGGVISALVAIPLAIGYGMFAFVGLGDA